MISFLKALLFAAPEILKFIRELDNANKEIRLRDQVKGMRKALKDKDEKALNDFFNA